MSLMKFTSVYLNQLNINDKTVKRLINKSLILQISDECDNLLIRFKENDMTMANSDFNIEIFKETELCKFGDNCILINDNCKNGLKSASTNTTNAFGSVKLQTWIIEFEDKQQCDNLHEILNCYKYNRNSTLSVFKQRTDETSASQYFQFYGYLSQQQNMMQDFIRTSTYQKAIILNYDDFHDKIVLDVGAGSGILSFFAIQAGARKVYAVEASSMAKFAENLVYSNKLAEKITVIPGKIEEIQLPEKVDLIISEPMGYMLFNERMLETYLHAKKWLKDIEPGVTRSRMFPSKGDLHVAPFTDASLYMEQLNKANFWYQENFHGVDLSSLRSAAVKEYFRQPIVDTFDIRICLAKSHRYTVDFETANENDLHNIHIPFSFNVHQSGEVHGLAFWFDVAFIGANQTVWLSTSPTQPLTHWYQVRCLVDTPLFVHRGQQLSGHVSLLSNKRQSYDVEIELYIENANNSNFTCSRARNTLDLKNPYFRYTGQPPQPPPGTHETSPSEQYWQTIDATNSPAVHNINNGSINGVLNGTVVNDISSFPQQTQMQHNNILVNNSGTSNIGVIGLHQPSMMNFGSLPSPGSTNRSSSGHSRSNNSSASAPPSSIGGGISPSFFSSNSSMSVLNTTNFPVSNSLMIGDYVTPGNIPGNIMVSGQNNLNYKH